MTYDNRRRLEGRERNTIIPDPIYLSSVARNSVCRNGSGTEIGEKRERMNEHDTHKPIFRRV